MPHSRPIVNLLHIGKTGGSAVKYALTLENAAIWTLETDTCSIRLHGHDTRLRHIPKGEWVVFFVRDPATRFVSGFNSRKREGRPRHHFPWSAEEAVAFSNFNAPNDLARALSSDDDDTRRAAVDAMRSIVHVNSSYWDWFQNERYFSRRLPDLLFVGFQESLAEDFEALKRKLALPAAIVLPEGDLEAHRSPTDVDRALDEVAVRNLHEWYSRDYDFVALCRAEAETINSSTL
jgi:hypothetical protein